MSVSATLLVATDESNDALLVQKLLTDEFGNVQASTRPETDVDDFDQHRPDVLILAFSELERSEQHYLRLLRLGAARSQAHRTIVLCDKSAVQRAYSLCRKRVFDDYVVFWPIGHDSPRLAMCVHQALRDLQAPAHDGPQAAEFAQSARVLAELAPLFERQMSQGGERIASVDHAVAEAQREIRATIDAFTRRLTETTGGSGLDPALLDGLRRELARLRDAGLDQPLQAISESVQPLKTWADDFREACAPHMEAAQQAGALARTVRPLVLAIDDDPMQCKLIASVLSVDDYRVVHANTGMEAIGVLRKLRPDLILLDVSMPGMDGLATLRHIRCNVSYNGVPVIMVTGQREQGIVKRCLQLGANDFVIKPYDRARLLERVRLALSKLESA